MVTVCQCSVKLHAKVLRCSLAGKSSTTDVHIKFTVDNEAVLSCSEMLPQCCLLLKKGMVS